MRTYNGNADHVEIFKRMPSDRDGRGLPYKCCAGGTCEQHATQRKLDRQWLGYAYQERLIDAGYYAHLSVA